MSYVFMVTSDLGVALKWSLQVMKAAGALVESRCYYKELSTAMLLRSMSYAAFHKLTSRQPAISCVASYLLVVQPP